MNNLTPEQQKLVENLAKVLAGLQAPMSINHAMIGAAFEPLVAIRDQLHLRGWPDDKEHLEALVKVLFPDAKIV